GFVRLLALHKPLNHDRNGRGDLLLLANCLARIVEEAAEEDRAVIPLDVDYFSPFENGRIVRYNAITEELEKLIAAFFKVLDLLRRQELTGNGPAQHILKDADLLWRHG